jgi:SAM-dependent methyltransferase
VNDFDDAYADEPGLFGDPYPELIEYFASRTRGRLLDLGSGQGRNAVALAGLGYEVTAVDASAVGVRQTVDAAAPRGWPVSGLVADLTDFPIRATYDVILLDMVVHAVDDGPVRQRLLHEVATAVAPGGTAYVVVPEPGPLVDEITAALSPWPTTVRHVHHHLSSGEHRGDYTFTAVIGERPPG